MRWLLVFSVLFSLNASDAFGRKTALQYAREIEAGIEDESAQMPFLKKYSDQAINGALERATKELRKKGAYGLADEIEFEWAAFYGQSLFTSERNIGDHKPILQWLSDRYRQIEAVLGVQLCKSLHISDIHSMNHGVPVVFKPCSFPLDNFTEDQRLEEYIRHFGGGNPGDDIYYGVLPVTGYWAANIGCLSAGGAFLCGPLAELTERLLGLVSPFLATKLYNRFCEGE